jgi:hypothetical protein
VCVFHSRKGCNVAQKQPPVHQNHAHSVHCTRPCLCVWTASRKLGSSMKVRVHKPHANCVAAYAVRLRIITMPPSPETTVSSHHNAHDRRRPCLGHESGHAHINILKMSVQAMLNKERLTSRPQTLTQSISLKPPTENARHELTRRFYSMQQGWQSIHKPVR